MTVKNDPSTPPIDAGAVESVAPPDVYSWPGPDVCITWHSERTGIENTWFTLTGRVVAVQLEADGDLHIELADAKDPKPGIVVCEVPAGPTWCENSQGHFQLDANTIPPAHSLDEGPYDERNAHHYSNRQAFWDLGHAPKDNQTAERGCLSVPFGTSSSDGVSGQSVAS